MSAVPEELEHYIAMEDAVYCNRVFSYSNESLCKLAFCEDHSCGIRVCVPRAVVVLTHDACEELWKLLGRNLGKESTKQ